MTDKALSHAVVIAGGGPTGLMLGAELKLAGVDVVVLEKRVNRERIQPGALGLHSRVIEIFDQRGIAERFLAAGEPMQVIAFAGVRLDISAFPTRHPYGLSLIQKHSERLLLEWAEEVGVPIEWGAEITGFTEMASGVSVELADGRRLATQYLIGCDGGRSFVRKAAGIGFPGSDPTVSHLLAEAELTDEPAWGVGRDTIGTHALSKSETGKARILVTEQVIGSAEPSLEMLREAMAAHFGTDYGAHNPTYITRFTDMTRQAETYRKGRVLLAGDAAHIHYPAGGFGMGIGLQDAVNLGWKLAEVVKGTAPESLLDTYHAERHPVTASLIGYTMASVILSRTDARSKALGAIVGELVGMAEPRLVTAGRMSGLDTRYDLGEGHPLLGRRMPDLDLVADGTTVRVYSLLHEARPVLLDLGIAGGLEAGAWTGRVQSIRASYDGAWELPVIGKVDAPKAVLVRPDGHVAWVGMDDDAGLSEALTRWFGPAG
jgi:3-(3-hydroxy-phenyl)propionate hydroxylase